MVFMAVPVDLCGGYARLPHSFDDGTLRLDRIVDMSPGERVGIICIARAALTRARCTRHIRDTNDTKRRQRDTPTIHGILTMTAAGAVDVAFPHATFHSFSGRYGRSGSRRRALRARDAIHQLRRLRRRS